MPSIKINKIKLNDGSHGLPKNPRFIKDDRFKALCNSVRDNPEYMPARPIIVDENGVILGGNMRYRACRELGMKDIPSNWVQAVEGWSVEKKRRFIIIDNRGFGEDDFDLLANEWDLKELIDAGFGEKELDGLLAADEPGDADAEPQIDKADELNKVWKVKPGDLFTIGDHKLLCGDSTKAEDVGRLMGGEKVGLCFTDPPYGIKVVTRNSVGGGGAFGGKKNLKSNKSNLIKSNRYDEIIGDETTDAARAHFLVCKKIKIEHFVIWGGNHFTDFLPVSRGGYAGIKSTELKEPQKTFPTLSLHGHHLTFRQELFGIDGKGFLKRANTTKKDATPRKSPSSLFLSVLICAPLRALCWTGSSAAAQEW